MEDDDFRGLTPDFQSFSEHQKSGDDTSYLGAELALDHKGAREGETLKASLQIYGNPQNDQSNIMVLSDGGALTTKQRDGLLFAEGQADWEHPIGKKEILSLGARWLQEDADYHYLFAGSGDPSLDFSAADAFRSTENTASAYATFQQTIGSWTVMPGLRLEEDNRRISSPGQPDLHIDRTDFFPTFHAEHRFGKSITLTLSYSRRIDRPGAYELHPYPTVTGPLSIWEGNASLRDQSTDAWEANLHYRHRKLDVGLILYDRETNGLWNPAYSVNADGLTVATMINAGHSANRGAELDVSTPLFRHVKVTSSANLFDSRVPIDAVAGSRSDETVRYTTNSTLEWDGPDHGGKPGDIVQLQIQYDSPSRSYEARSGSFFIPILTATHSFTRKLSLTATVDGFGPLHSRQQIWTPLLQQYGDMRQLFPEFKLKLLKNLRELIRQNAD